MNPEDYSCEILLEKTTPEKAKDTSFPTDAYNVVYTVDGEDRLDVCRAQKAANIFDLYYDRYKNVKALSMDQELFHQIVFVLNHHQRKKVKL